MVFYVLELGVPLKNDNFYKIFHENINAFILSIKNELNMITNIN
jgi:hypothetical protein